MKRLTMFILAALTLLGLCACVGQSREEASEVTAPPATAEPVATAAVATVTASVSTEESAAYAIPTSVEPLALPE
ncbi:MAG: hypothetical protein LUH42_05220, partial [Oscillospiraceae bacterium]|nr:hypothetical protein [Oscillospiraceae bacterium]